MKPPRPRVSLVLVLLALSSPLQGVALADGMVIPQMAYALPQIPDQRALIHYAGGIETLVIETSFAGSGTNFAWVVPLPAIPKIEPVPTGLFPTLQTIFQPKVVLAVKPYWIALPIAAVVVGGMIVLRRSSLAVLLFLFLLFFVGLLFQPALSKSRGGIGPGPEMATVHILNRQTVGLFDTTTIQSTSPAALTSWLHDNGFSVPTNAEPIISRYVREGWVFAAARLLCEASQTTNQATHPLAFTFKTAKPVYPLRLTGAATTSCRVDLYVFGPSRAGARGFQVARCEAPKYDTESGSRRMDAGELRIRHAELAKLVARAPVATKLSGLLDASLMVRDAYVRWDPYQPSGGAVYSPAAALTLSGNVAALLFMGLVVAWWILWRTKGPDRLPLRKWGPWLTPSALALGLMFYALLPRADMASTRVLRLHGGMIGSDMLQLEMLVEDELMRTNAFASVASSGRALTPAEFKGLLDLVARDFQPSRETVVSTHDVLTNIFSGERIRLEASPGNVIMRPAPGTRLTRDDIVLLSEVTHPYELVWHDLDGAEASTNIVIAGRWRR